MRALDWVLFRLRWRWRIPRFEDDTWRHVPPPDPSIIVRARRYW
jgi:hypothetical protein